MSIEENRREAFEAHARKKGLDLGYRNYPGVGQFYTCARTLLAWESWNGAMDSLEDYQELIGVLYQVLGELDAPEKVLDVLVAASEGRKFRGMMDGLLPLEHKASGDFSEAMEVDLPHHLDHTYEDSYGRIDQEKLRRDQIKAIEACGLKVKV